MVAKDKSRCVRHDPKAWVYKSDPDRPGWVTVHCGDCGYWIGRGPRETEKKNPAKTTKSKSKKKEESDTESVAFLEGKYDAQE